VAPHGSPTRPTDGMRPPRTPVAVKSFGTLTGTFAIYGGTTTTRACGCHPVGGTLQLDSGHGRPIVVNVGPSGQFTARIPGGRYRVKAGTGGASQWPVGSCDILRYASQPGAPRSQHLYLTIRPSGVTDVEVGCGAL
jgi:hypothetical protein